MEILDMADHMHEVSAHEQRNERKGADCDQQCLHLRAILFFLPRRLVCVS